MGSRSKGAFAPASSVGTASGSTAPAGGLPPHLSFTLEASSRALLDMLMQDERYGAVLTGADGRILDLAGNAGGLLGLHAGELIGLPLESIAELDGQPSADGPLIRARLRRGHAVGSALNCLYLPSDPTAACRLLVLQAESQAALAGLPLPQPAAEALLHGIQHSTRTMLWVSDPELQHFLYASPGFTHLWGNSGTVAPTPDTWRKAVLDEDRHRLDAFIAAQHAGRIADSELRIRRDDGRVVWLWVHSCPWVDRQRRARVTGFMIDVSKLRNGAEGTDTTWALLLREGHHRIKNSLQALAALLRRHADTSGDHREILTEAVGQIRAIAAVHELYSQDGQPRASLYGLIHALAHSVQGLYPGRPAVEIGSLPGMATAPLQRAEIHTLAVMINELLTNALKHGRPDSPVPIRIVSNCDDDLCVLRIDNPGHLPADFDFRKGRGLGSGLNLLAALADPPGSELDIFQAGPDTVRARLSLQTRRILDFREGHPHGR